MAAFGLAGIIESLGVDESTSAALGIAGIISDCTIGIAGIISDCTIGIAGIISEADSAIVVLALGMAATFEETVGKGLFASSPTFGEAGILAAIGLAGIIESLGVDESTSAALGIAGIISDCTSGIAGIISDCTIGIAG